MSDKKPVHRKPKVDDSFWSKVSIQGPDECWEWAYSRHRQGYGRVRSEGKIVLSHRLLYMSIHGYLDPSIKVRHICDNPPCCNPVHLVSGTQADNIKDMHDRGRWNAGDQAGSRNPGSKLNEDQVSIIRDMLANGVKQAMIVVQFGVTQPTVSGIKHGKSWSP